MQVDDKQYDRVTEDPEVMHHACGRYAWLRGAGPKDVSEEVHYERTIELKVDETVQFTCCGFSTGPNTGRWEAWRHRRTRVIMLLVYFNWQGMDDFANVHKMVQMNRQGIDSVSYTHLTLPTNREV